MLAGGAELVGAVLIPTAVRQLAKVSLDQMLRRRLLPATGAGQTVRKNICWDYLEKFAIGVITRSSV